ncbi:TlyA family RNA methyltransferase [Pseudoclavibacter sp. RFBG4]|uniref:TlyA family RNA methyltransferase n=1 Tax=Pseudoclavibacter sp. RFBG4 TaxID=2080575 RepID=UPI002157DB0E|nr:TlyA family RNA methyltransferase [Pseudoclavibacter sp. RFBG4]
MNGPITSPEGGPLKRLDTELTHRGLARSRTAAARLIEAGLVSVNGAQASKTGLRVADHDELTIAGGDDFVSRAAHKLVAGLDAVPTLDPTGRVALDVGASTGGFTQVLLSRGARHVVALDVGHDQLAPSVREDPRVSNLEGVNARFVDAEQLDELLAAAESPVRSADIDLVVGDLSFISLTKVIAPILAMAPGIVDAVLLIKPQFEVGRTGVKGGIVHDRRLVAPALERVLVEAAGCGLELVSLRPSPIVGTHGNSEFVAVFRTSRGSSPADADRLDTLRRAIVEAEDLEADR